MGTLRGFDEYVNMVLEDAVEIEITTEGRREVRYRGHLVQCGASLY